MTRDPRIDDKIARAPPFARPILEHLRGLVHATIPDAGEAIKWSMPHFTYRGKNLAGMAAFKAHCAFMIHGEGRQGEGRQGEGGGDDAGMGQFGKIASLADLPDDEELAVKLCQARARIDAMGTATKRPTTEPRPQRIIEVPEDFAVALATEPAARTYFDGLAPSHRYEYLEWITAAKRPETRIRRIGEAVTWLAEGKRRNWKYER